MKLQASPLKPGAAPAHTASTYDEWLAGAAVLLAGLGLVMVASASISIADRAFADPLHYFWRQCLAAALGLAAILVLIRIPLRLVERLSLPFLLVGIALLVAVLIPGLGHEVNGSMRWVSFGPIALQVSEPVKVIVIVYLAGYLVRHAGDVRATFKGFIKPIGVLTAIALLLLLQPDYGAAVVLFATGLGMLFLGGVPILRFMAWGLAAFTALCTLAVLTPYRMQRLLTFIDPWADPYASGFQLTQALIAFGRGEWFGVGLGSSIQKLFYLPEVHTDFLFAVIAEELGLIGSVAVIAMFTFLIWRIFHLGALAAAKGQSFAAYLAYGIGMLIGCQAFVNIGVNMGVLPTKGLTLPLMSYGSNSMVITCAALGLVLRVTRETRELSGRGLRRDGPIG